MTLLQEINNLTWYNSVEKLKSILKRTNTAVQNLVTTVTALQTNSVIVGIAEIGATNITLGTPFIVGEKYAIHPNGGDYTNIGWVQDSKIFTATGTTPTTQGNPGTTIQLISNIKTVFYNDIDSNLTIAPIDGTSSTYKIEITNNAFLETKTYPTSTLTLSRVDDNTFTLNAASLINSGTINKMYFKIEVYN